MAEKRSIGVASIAMGAIAADGDMGTTLTALGVTYKDSADLQQEDAQVTDIESEENDDPEESISIKGKTTLKWSIMDMTPETLVKVLGGTVTGTAPATKWNAPATVESIERSIKVTAKNGVIYEIPRAKINAKLNVKLSKTGVALVDITATVMTPTKAGVLPITIY